MSFHRPPPASAVTKLCPKIIVEGTRLTGKTDLAFALNEHPRIVGVRKYRYHSPIISAEWNGITRAPWGASLINFEREYEEIVLETYRTWMKLFELYKYYSWVVDRFHISTQTSRFLYADRKYDFNWLERRLARLGFCLVFCWRSPSSFEEARVRRLKISSNPSQYEDLSIFLREQKVMEDLVNHSILPKMVIDVTESPIERTVSLVADWMESTGALTGPPDDPA